MTTILLIIAILLIVAYVLILISHDRRVRREQLAMQEVLQGNSEHLQSAAMHLYLDLALKASKIEAIDYEQPLAMYPEQEEGK